MHGEVLGLLAIGGVLLGGCSTSVPCDLARQETELEAFAGSGAVDCGFAQPGSSAGPVDDCLLRAARSGTPFHVRYRGKGIVAGASRAGDGQLQFSEFWPTGRATGDDATQTGSIDRVFCQNEFRFVPIDCVGGECQIPISCPRQTGFEEVCRE
jgi:hypothetical protein